MFSWRRKAPRERRRRKRLGGSGGMLPQEIFKIEYSETPFPAFLEPRKQFPRQCWRSLKFSLKSKLLNDALVRKIYNTVVKKKSPILISKYRTWNGKRPDETSGLRPQMKTLYYEDNRMWKMAKWDFALIMTLERKWKTQSLETDHARKISTEF